MYAARKVVRLEVEADEDLRELIVTAAPDKGVAALLLKDCHLVEAALKAERRLVSKDERSRRHFRRACPHVPALRKVCWVNPARREERPLDWLRTGAPLDRHLHLGHATGA
jgi:hypothetical protein